MLDKPTNYQQPQTLGPVPGWYIYSWWHSVSPANGCRSHDSALDSWAYGIQCPVMVSPNAGPAQPGRAVVPGWSPYMATETGFRPAHGGWVRSEMLVCPEVDMSRWCVCPGDRGIGYVGDGYVQRPCTGRYSPPYWHLVVATEVGGMHPTGMYSYFYSCFVNISVNLQ